MIEILSFFRSVVYNINANTEFFMCCCRTARNAHNFRILPISLKPIFNSAFNSTGLFYVYKNTLMIHFDSANTKKNQNEMKNEK